MTNIRLDVIKALSLPYVSKPVELAPWPCRGAGLPSLLIDRSRFVNAVRLGPAVVSCCAINGAATWLFSAGRRAWFLTTYPPVAPYTSRRIFGRHLWSV